MTFSSSDSDSEDSSMPLAQLGKRPLGSNSVRSINESDSEEENEFDFNVEEAKLSSSEDDDDEDTIDDEDTVDDEYGSEPTPKKVKKLGNGSNKSPARSPKKKADDDSFIADEEEYSLFDDEDSSDSSSDDDTPLVSLKSPKPRKSPAKKKPTTKKTISAKKKDKKSAKKKKETKTTTKKKKSDTPRKTDALLTLSGNLYNNCDKGKLIQSILCRWWYAITWPDPSVLKKTPPENFDRLDGIPGVYICTEGTNVGKIIDYRDKSTCPNFINFAKKPTEDLVVLLMTAIEKQKQALIVAEGEGTQTEKDLDALAKWTRKLNAKKVDKDAEKVLKAVKMKL